MKPQQLNLTATDVEHLEQMHRAVEECAMLADGEIGKRHTQIGNLLLENVHRLELDEDIIQLCAFARAAACEAMSASVRDKHFPSSCWSPSSWRKVPPFFAKVDGRNTASSEVRPPDRQKSAMVDTFATILLNDPKYTAGARLLIDYAERHMLWTPADAVYE